VQHLKGARHLPAVEESLLPHHVLEKGDLALVDQEHKLAGLREVGLGRKQRDRREPIVAIARHGGRRDRQPRSAPAITPSIR
jgi:hypothetical protein